MSIQSHTFGSVRLTSDDAKKFENQVTYGKPKKEAVNSLSRGTVLAKQFDKNGKLTFKLTPKKK